VEYSNAELDDLIILRSDGYPTYNFSVVIDDVSMEITHVIRGNDHLNNTPRQIQIYEALGAPLPKFGHVSMILGPDKKKLSKRHGAQSVMEYQKMGYVPEAVVNYLVRLGWSCGDEEEFTREDLVGKFTLEAVGKSPAAINPGKLDWLNSQHMKRMDPAMLGELLRPFIEDRGHQVKDPDLLAKVVLSLRERAKTLVEMAESAEFYFAEDVVYDPKSAGKFLRPEDGPGLREVLALVSNLPALEKGRCHELVQGLAETRGEPMVKIAQPLRVALTGRSASPPIDEVMEALGRDRVIRRIGKALLFIDHESGQGPVA
jgi:glutamyl-tRNA synthetase